MRTEVLDVQEALQRGTALPWALIRCMSSVSLGPSRPVEDAEELLEARYFNQQEEIRIFRRGSGLQAAHLLAEPEDRTISRKYRIGNPKLGKTVTVVSQIKTDEDGQAYLAAARLAGWEGRA